MQSQFSNEDNRICKLEGKDEMDLKGKNKLDPIGLMIKHTGLKIYNQPDNSKSLSQSCSSIEDRNKTDVMNHKKERKKSKKKKHKYDRKEEKMRKRKRSHSRSHKHSKRRKQSDSSEDDRSKSKKSSKKSKKRYSSDDDSSSESSNSDYSSNDSEDEKKKEEMMKKLRAERLKREEIERKRAEKLISGCHPDKPEIEKPPEIKQKYNSQFNPMFARQNKEPQFKLQSGVKYWL